VWTYGRVEVQSQRLSQVQEDATRHPFVNEERWLELLRQLNEVPGINVDGTVITKRPSLLLSALAEPELRNGNRETRRGAFVGRDPRFVRLHSDAEVRRWLEEQSDPYRG
jgi:hypothetical protein